MEGQLLGCVRLYLDVDYFQSSSLLFELFVLVVIFNFHVPGISNFKTRVFFSECFIKIKLILEF